MGYRRKTPAVLLCKSIVISIQWFQIPHIITFTTIYNLAVLFLGARVSQNHSLVPQLIVYIVVCFAHFIYASCRIMVFVYRCILRVRGQFGPWLIRTLANSDLIRTSAVANSRSELANDFF